MYSYSQKGIVHILGLLIIFLGLATGLYLVSHQTIFKSRADAVVSNTSVLGYNTVGSSSAGSVNKLIASKFQMPASTDGTALSLSVAVGTLDATNKSYSMAIYNDNAGYPGSLLASTATGTLTVIDNFAQSTLNLTDQIQALVAGNNYWLVYWTNGANGIRYNSGSTPVVSLGQTFSGTWPASFPAGGSTGTRNFSIYATYTISNPTPPTPIPSPTPTPTSGPTNTPTPTGTPAPSGNPVPNPPGSSVTLNSQTSYACPYPNCTGNIYNITVTTGGITKRASLRESRQQSTPRGTVILTVGSGGNGYYGDFGGEMATTVSTVFSQGFQIFEVNWIDPLGSRINGYKPTFIMYGDVVRWIYNTPGIAQVPSVMCAAGNSGGGMQIGFSLTDPNYSTKNVLDMVIIGGGPPSTRQDIGCFSNQLGLPGDPAAYSSADAGKMDSVHPWVSPNNYCYLAVTNSSYVAPSSAVTASRQDSVVAFDDGNPGTTRDLNYPNTKVNFVEGGNDYLKNQGHKFYDAITTSLKFFEEIAGAPHGVQATTAGAAEIKRLFDTECHAG